MDVNVYRNTFQEALQANAASENKWRLYKSELEKTKGNLNQYVKSLSHEIMVPIGQKAFLRGKLIHTNEVTVSHGASYFSDVSSAEAIEIIEKRLQNCDQQLTALEKEKELFSNKINLPQDAFGEGKEIIEEFDDEAENEWRKKHAESVRKQKMKEREERQNSREDKDISKVLEEYEMMEELAEELEKMEVNDDDTLQKILSGEIKVPESKKRVARVPPSDTADGTAKISVEATPSEAAATPATQEAIDNDLITQNNQEIVDLLKNYRCKIKEVLKNVRKDDERNLNLFLDLIELKDDIEDDIRRMNDDEESLESDEKDSDDETASTELKPPEDQKRVRFSKSLEDVKIIESKSELIEASAQSESNTIEIHFQHSHAEFTPTPSDSDTVAHPGEIYEKFHKPHIESQVPATKSILKNREKNGKIREKDEKKVTKIFSSDIPVIGEVVEHRKDIAEYLKGEEEIIHVAAKDVAKKVSKFKQMRMKS